MWKRVKASSLDNLLPVGRASPVLELESAGPRYCVSLTWEQLTVRQMESMKASCQQCELEQRSSWPQSSGGQEVYIPGNHLIDHIPAPLQQQTSEPAAEHTPLQATQPAETASRAAQPWRLVLPIPLSPTVWWRIFVSSSAPGWARICHMDLLAVLAILA